MAAPSISTLSALRTELGAMNWLIAREIEREVREGGSRTGLSSALQVLARRRSA